MSKFTYGDIVTQLDGGLTPADLRVLATLEQTTKPICIEEIIELGNLSVGAANKSIAKLTRMGKTSYTIFNKKRRYILPPIGNHSQRHSG